MNYYNEIKDELINDEKPKVQDLMLEDTLF